jgi:hypothetical protein
VCLQQQRGWEKHAVLDVMIQYVAVTLQAINSFLANTKLVGHLG